MRRGADESDRGLVAVCAGDELVRERVEAALLLGGEETLISAESVQDLPEACPASVVVLACGLGPFGPSREIAAVRAKLPQVALVIVAIGFLTRSVRKLLNGDVDGLVLEADIEQALVPTVDAVLAEQLCVPASARSALAQPVFSHREKQVLALVLAGLTNGEIASRMYLSESTIKSHVASSFRKLGVSSRAEAAKRLLEPDPETGTPPNWITHASTLVATRELI